MRCFWFINKRFYSPGQDSDVVSGKKKKKKKPKSVYVDGVLIEIPVSPKGSGKFAKGYVAMTAQEEEDYNKDILDEEDFYKWLVFKTFKDLFMK